MTIELSVEEILSRYAAPTAGAATLLCDCHPPDSVAFRVISDDLSYEDVSFGALGERSARLAGALAQLGVGPGDRVATLMGKSVELPAVMLATWRLGAVYVPLFTAFAPQAIATRLSDTDSKVVVTDVEQSGKLAPSSGVPADPPWKVVVAGGPAEPAGALSLSGLLASGRAETTAYVGGGDWSLVHTLTSGTTGRPKGVVHPLTYAAGWEVYLRYGLDLRAGEAYWCAADPGWAYGLYAGFIAPMAMGVPSHIVRGGFSAEQCLKVLAEYRIGNFAAAPTVYRALRVSASPPPEVHLRRASSAGEPLTPEVNEWAREALGVEVHDHYGQTELGMVLGNHQHPDLRRPVKPGSMGRALPGWTVAVLRGDADEPAPDDTLGRIAVDAQGSPLMTFHGYHGQSHPTGKFTANGRWYLTGDAGSRDADGDFRFSARDDDVIIMAGYRIGPFDIESVLMQHNAVSECAVIAVPDPARGEVVEAVVVTRPAHPPSDELASELQRLVKDRYAAHAYPRHVRFVDALPKTPSGKIQRSVLRELRIAQQADAQGTT